MCCWDLFRSRDQDRDLGHQVSRRDLGLQVLRPRPWPSGLETKTETLAIRSRDRDLGLQVLRPRPWPSGLETKTETLDFRSRDRDLHKMNLSLETMVSRSQHWQELSKHGTVGIFLHKTPISVNRSVSLALHFNGRFSRWNWVSQYQNVSILDFIGAKGDGGGDDKLEL